ncbi:hypothetical protein D3C72_1999060 [compost metagenome]
MLWSITDFMVGIIAIINIYAIFNLRKLVVKEYENYISIKKHKSIFKVISLRKLIGKK